MARAADPQAAPATLQPMREMTEALRGVRGLLLDLDGVIVMKGAALPGASDALAALDARGLPYRVVTNTSAMSRATLAGFGRRAGIDIPAERITSALSATAAWTARRLAGRPLFVIGTDEAKTEFAGQRLLTREQMLAGAAADAVVVGDNEDDVRYDLLNAAFRLVRGGARLIAMHRNPWWLMPDGPRIDSGAWVVALEFATGVRATVLGKPSAAFFREGLRGLAADLGVRRLAPGTIAMVGDDIATDVLAAQRIGLRGVFVRSGKHGDAELASAARRGRTPDAVARSLADVVAAID